LTGWSKQFAVNPSIGLLCCVKITETAEYQIEMIQLLRGLCGL
jgi:hypothetical protein